MSEGWIHLDRHLLDHWVWKDEPFSKGQAWVDLLLLANHTTEKIPYKDGVITCKRGTVNRSFLWLAERWKWDRRKVRRFLNCLEMDGMVSINSTTQRTTITIENYSKFQGNGTTNGTQNVQPMVQRMHTYKNDKNEKNNISGNKFCDFQQQEYDFEAISKMLQN